MPLNIPPGTGLAAWRFSLAGDPEEMVTTCGIDLGNAEGDFAEAANNCFRAWSQSFPASQLDSDWTFQGVRLWVGQDGGSTVPYDSTLAPYSGSSSGVTPVQNTALLVKKSTALPGRKGRGRFYWPVYGLSSGGWTPAGQIATATYADFQDRFGDMYTRMITASDGLTFIIVPLLFHSDATPPTDIIAFTLDHRLATQRRRLRK